MKHIPHTTRIFIGLLIISLLLTYIAITLSHYRERLIFDYGTVMHKPGAQQEPISTIDTKDWSSYKDKAYPIAFAHPETWTVSNNLVGDFYDITVNIPNTNQDIHIYVNEDSYYALDGFKKEPYKLGGLEGSIVNNNLIGVKAGEYYYTFDASMVAAEFSDQFNALLKTVTFEQVSDL